MWGKKEPSGRTYEWRDGTVHDHPEPAGHKGRSSGYDPDNDTSKCGLSATQHSLHEQEAAARNNRDWQEAARVKHMLDNADSRSHWISKAVELRQEYSDDPAFAQ